MILDAVPSDYEPVAQGVLDGALEPEGPEPSCSPKDRKRFGSSYLEIRARSFINVNCRHFENHGRGLSLMGKSASNVRVLVVDATRFSGRDHGPVSVDRGVGPEDLKFFGR